jgi:signal peptidase I
MEQQQQQYYPEYPASEVTRPEEPVKRRGPWSVVRELFQTAFIALLIYVVLQVVISPYEVDGASMTPALRDQERVLVNRMAYVGLDLNRLRNVLPGPDSQSADVRHPFGLPNRGDIIVLNPPTRDSSDEPYIKRVIGLPGDSVSFRQGYVYINGQRLNESYIEGPITTCRGQHCEIGTIPDGTVYVLGDNREHSADSRTFGLVPVDHLVGEAFFANWPLDVIGPISGADYGE